VACSELLFIDVCALKRNFKDILSDLVLEHDHFRNDFAVLFRVVALVGLSARLFRLFALGMQLFAGLRAHELQELQEVLGLQNIRAVLVFVVRSGEGFFVEGLEKLLFVEFGFRQLFSLNFIATFLFARHEAVDDCCADESSTASERVH
jgi:hypothetical protein